MSLIALNRPDTLWWPDMKKRHSGFTMIELIITIAIVGILAGMAAPSMSVMLKNNRLATIINDLTGDLALARSESAKRGHRVTLCVSSTGTGCTASTDWAVGRIAFVDQNGNGAVDAGDTILQVSPALSGNTVLSFKDTTLTSLGVIQYRPKGVTDETGIFKLCDDRTGTFGREIAISNTGRASLAATGIACP